LSSVGPGIVIIRRPWWSWRGLAALLLFFLWFSSAEAAYQITGISFSPSPGEIQVNVRADGPVQYDYFTMEETQPQLVIDLGDAVYAVNRHRFEPSATGVVQRVRTSQYRPYPHPVVRIVLDFRQMTPFEITTGDQGLTITVPTPIVGEKVEQISRDASGESLERPEPSVKTKLVDESAGDEMTMETAEKADAEKMESESENPAALEPPVIDVSPAPLPRSESPPLESSKQESVPPESASAAETEAGSDTTISAPQPGSLMARLAALGIREPVSYHSGSRRDPFVALPAQQEVEFGQTPLPDVEKLSIVGILQGADGYRALAQDNENNGYVLRKGDRVLYGYVARIEAERVVFYLNRRGLDRTVILKIPQ